MRFVDIGYYTKDQMLNLFKQWECDQELPTSKREVFIAFPNRTCLKITKSNAKSTYGKTLWLLSYHNANAEEQPS